MAAAMVLGLIIIGSRDPYWLENPSQAWLRASKTEDRLEVTSDYARNLTCYGLTQCFRNGLALILEPMIQAVRGLLHLAGVDDTVAHRAAIVGVGALWRLVAIGSFVALTSRLCGRSNFRATLVVLAGTTVVFSGIVLRLAAEFLVRAAGTSLNSNLADRIRNAFEDFPVEHLIFYDYAHLIIIPALVICLPRFQALDRSFSRRRAALTWLLTGLVVSTFFEFYGVLVALAIHLFVMLSRHHPVASHRHIFVRMSLFMIAGNVIWVLGVLVASRWGEMSVTSSPYFRPDRGIGSQLALMSETASRYRTRNVSMFGSIVVQVALLVGQAFVVGVACAFLLSRFDRAHRAIKDHGWHAPLAVLIAFSILTIGSFFNSNLIAENGRQTLGLQLATFVLAITTIHRSTSKG
jgi:hypothetical protein